MAIQQLSVPQSDPLSDWIKAVQANAVSLIEAVRKVDVNKIKELLVQLRRLERNIYRRVRRSKVLTYAEKRELRKLLAELQAIQMKEGHELKADHLSSLKVLAGEEEIISEEMRRKMLKELSGNLNEQYPKVKETFQAVLDQLESGDIIGMSYSHTNGEFGEAVKVFEPATGTRVSHVGLIDVRKTLFGRRKVVIIEALETVSTRPIEDFLLEADGKVAIYRYKNGLTPEQQRKIINTAVSWTKRWYVFWKKAVKYDYHLAPGLNELYCSEVVDEAYKATGIQLSNHYVSVDLVMKKIKEFYDKHGYELFGMSYPSAEAAVGKVVGTQGYYPVDDLLKKSVVTPQDVMINGNTKKIFDNLT